MLVIAIVPAVVMLVGLFMYILAANPKVAELGRIMFFAGLVAVCFAMTDEKMTIGR